MGHGCLAPPIPFGAAKHATTLSAETVEELIHRADETLYRAEEPQVLTKAPNRTFAETPPPTRVGAQCVYR
jgi:hypothetical protein